MEIQFLNKGIYHYIDAKAGTVTELEESGRMYQLYMLTENNLSYVLHAEMLCTNAEVWLSHSTESCYCLRSMLMQGRMDGTLLRMILEQIIKGISELELYLLDANDLVLRPENMFWNPEKKCIQMICIPGYQIPINQQLRMLLEGLMPCFDHSDYEGERLLYMCYSFVEDEWQGLSGLIGFLRQTDLRIEKQPIVTCENKQEPEECHYQTNFEIQNENGKDTIYSKRFLLFVLAGGAALALIIKYLFFDGTTGTAIFGIGWLLALIVLAIMTVREKEEDSDDAMQEYALIHEHGEYNPKMETLPQFDVISETGCSKLVPLTNGALEPLCLNMSISTVTIGRDKKTDYRVQTTQISRMHAKLYNKSTGLFLEDQNSTNGTFINARRIPALKQYKLNKGDVIGFANEEFFVS